VKDSSGRIQFLIVGSIVVGASVCGDVVLGFPILHERSHEIPARYFVRYLHAWRTQSVAKAKQRRAEFRPWAPEVFFRRGHGWIFQAWQKGLFPGGSAVAKFNFTNSKLREGHFSTAKLIGKCIAKIQGWGAKFSPCDAHGRDATLAHVFRTKKTVFRKAPIFSNLAPATAAQALTRCLRHKPTKPNPLFVFCVLFFIQCRRVKARPRAQWFAFHLRESSQGDRHVPTTT